jgi:hypothetical protein
MKKGAGCNLDQRHGADTTTPEVGRRLQHARNGPIGNRPRTVSRLRRCGRSRSRRWALTFAAVEAHEPGHANHLT